MNRNYQNSIVQGWKKQHSIEQLRDHEILVFKGNKQSKAQLQIMQEVRKPKPHSQVRAGRRFSADTESFHHISPDGIWSEPSNLDKNLIMRYTGDLRTDVVTLAFENEKDDTLLLTSELEHPITAILDHIWPLFAEHDQQSKHEQRKMRTRPDGDRRDGRKDTIEPVVCIFHNLTYDIGRLMRSHMQFLRSVVSAVEDTYRFNVGDYEIEVNKGVYTGSAPFFEWYIRKDGQIIRLLGRDLLGYLKNSLKEIGKSFFPDNPELWKDDIETGTFNLPYEDVVAGATAETLRGKYGMDIVKDIQDFVSTPIETFWEYAKQDPKVTLRAYMKLTDLLMEVSPVAIGKDGIIPPSAPACAARIAASFASEDKWQLAPRAVQQMGSTTYCGAYVDSRKNQSVANMKVKDITSSYPFIMHQLPNPANCEYEELYPQAWTQDTFEYLKGQFGCVVFSGEGLDDRRPATRTHDCDNNRLVYQYGKIDCSFTTIQELLYGVASGRLRVDAIHSGYVIRTIDGESYLKLYIAELFKIKADANLSGNKPLELLAKILMNAYYGKLLELRQQSTRYDGFTLELQLAIYDYSMECPTPNGDMLIWKEFNTTQLIPTIERIYIEQGGEGVERFVTALWTSCDPNPDKESDLYKEYLSFKDILDELAPMLVDHVDFYEGSNEITLKELLNITDNSTWKAGTYYNPIFGCCITGGAAARVSLFAHCMDAQQVDTDSGMYQATDDEGSRMEEYYRLEELCGYPSPREGLGSWATELTNGTGRLLKNKMYYLEGVDTKGNPKTKMAIHGMGGMPKKPNKNGIYQAIHYMDELATSGKTEYISKGKPEPLKQYALHMTGVLQSDTVQKEAGTWIQEKRTMTLAPDPNQWIDINGERHWKPFVEQEWLKAERAKLERRGNFYHDGYQPPTSFMKYSMEHSKQPLASVSGLK